MADQNYVSDELIHFVARSERRDEGKQFKLLLSILRSRQLKASHRGELGVSGTVMADDLKELTHNEAVREAAVCFCDIPRDHLQIQMDKYGKFGIAFTKAYLLTRGASPVFYVARNSAPPPHPGIGPKTLGERWSVLRNELCDLQSEMRRYTAAWQPTWASRLQSTSKFSPKETPKELEILGRMDALFSELDEMVFSRIVSFSRPWQKSGRAIKQVEVEVFRP
jgi:hypothetical protein